MVDGKTRRKLLTLWLLSGCLSVLNQAFCFLRCCISQPPLAVVSALLCFLNDTHAHTTHTLGGASSLSTLTPARPCYSPRQQPTRHAKAYHPPLPRLSAHHRAHEWSQCERSPHRSHRTTAVQRQQRHHRRTGNRNTQKEVTTQRTAAQLSSDSAEQTAAHCPVC